MWAKDCDQCFGQICTREYYIALKNEKQVQDFRFY